MNKQKDYSTFDTLAERYERYVSTFPGKPWFGWDDVSGERAIDIGCGAGQAAHLLSSRFKKVIGLDICSELIALARQKHNNSNIDYIVEDIMDFHDPERFDFVYSHTMMHHLKNYEEGLIKIKELVKTGGKLVLIDNVSDTYRTPPKWSYTIPAKLEFIPNIFRMGFGKACFLLGFWHDKEWLNHLASDTYLSRKEFKEMYLAVFPNSEIVDLGFANAIKWINA